MGDVTPIPQPLSDGRYEGGNGTYFVELRIDVGDSQVVSGDVFLAGAAPRRPVASVRTEPGLAVTQPYGAWRAVWQSSDRVVVPGDLAVEPVPGPGAAAVVRLRPDRGLNGLPAGEEVIVLVQWAAAEFRRLGVETETEMDVVLPRALQWDGLRITVRECLRRAGFEASGVGQSGMLPRNVPGWEWSESSIFDLQRDLQRLHDVMAGSAQAALAVPSWEVHLLMLTRATKPGLFGVMFDVIDLLPRQGLAVFVQEIRDRTPVDEEDRRIIHTTVHELGHALNLAHRFERVLGRANSMSFMNYDSEYRGGGREDDYWRQFAYRFDPDEVSFIRHGPLSSVMPGTAPFHSVNYWGSTPGASQDFVPDEPTPGFRLALEPPAAGTLFDFGQPVYLQVSLTNNGTRDVILPPEALDIKAGLLEVLVERYSGVGGTRVSEAQPFVPMLQRCLDLRSRPSVLPPGIPRTENISLSFGAGGFTMADPGRYRLTPLLTIADPDDPGRSATLVIRGESLTVQVAYPKTRRDEMNAMELFRPDVGAWFALGGSNALSQAREVLTEMGEARRKDARDTSDPIASVIARSLGIYASRPYVRYRDGEYVRHPAEAGRAADLLGGLAKDATAMRCFDPATAQETRKLAKEQRAKAKRWVRPARPRRR
jgi:hypothetical protein